MTKNSHFDKKKITFLRKIQILTKNTHFDEKTQSDKQFQIRIMIRNWIR